MIRINNSIVKEIMRNIFGLLIFLIFTLSISYKLFGGIVGYADNQYYFTNNNYNFLSLWQDYSLGIYQPLLFPLSGYFTRLLNLLIKDQNIISYFVNYFPVYLTSIVTFFIAKKISGNLFYSYFIGFFIILNNFILEQLIYFSGVYFLNVIALIILFYLIYEIYYSSIDYKKILFIILNSVLITHPFFFIMYLILIFLFFIFYLFKKINKRKSFSLLSIFLGVILVHSYWLIPLIQSQFSQTEGEWYRGNLNPVYEGFKATANYINLFNYANYPGLVSFKLHQGISQYFFYFTILACLTLIIFYLKKKKDNDKKYMFFLMVVFLLFFTLALGPNSKLTGSIWTWAFNNIGGFAFFRSFTRFLIVPLITIIFLFAIFISKWKLKIIYKNIIIAILIIFLFSTNLIFFTGNLKGTLGSYNVPKEYNQLNEEYFLNDSKNYSVISFPNIGYESYSWSINENIKDFPQMLYFNIYFFSKPIIYNCYALQLNSYNELFKKVFAYNDNFKFYDGFDNDLSYFNIRYVLVRKDLFDILNIDKKVDFQKYYNYFKNNKNYSLKEDNNYFTLFERNNYTPLFLSENIYFKKINQTKYRLSIENLKTSQKLLFLENFHKGWKLYLEPIPIKSTYQVSTTNNAADNNSGAEPDNVNSTNVFEYLSTQKLLEGDEFSYLWRQQVFDESHIKVNEYANGWSIDPEYIKKNFDKKYYVENPDGSINIELVLYFKPQLFYYIGIIISVTTFIFCIIFLIIKLLRIKFRNNSFKA